MIEQSAEYEQLIMSAVDRAGVLLLETRDPIGSICKQLREELQTEQHPYISPFDIRRTFKQKHGRAMGRFREEQTGVKESDIVKEANEEAKAPKLKIAERLLANTEFNIGHVGLLSGFGRQGLSGIFKRFGLPTPKQYRLHNFTKPSVYSQQKATRQRMHINGSMRLSKQRNSSVMAWTKLHDHVGDDRAVLSVSITGLGFDVVSVGYRTRASVTGAIIVKTGFAIPLNDTHSESEEVIVRLGNGDEVGVKCSYDCIARVLGIEIIGRYVPSAIEFTAMITTTEL